jgi:hypothetical protein
MDDVLEDAGELLGGQASSGGSVLRDVRRPPYESDGWRRELKG